MVATFIFNPSQAKDLKIKTFKGFSIEWAKFIITNRDKAQNQHDYDLVIGPVADAVVDQEIIRYRKQYGKQYLNPDNLRILVSRINQFGINYIQYCFCTEKSIKLLIKD